MLNCNDDKNKLFQKEGWSSTDLLMAVFLKRYISYDIHKVERKFTIFYKNYLELLYFALYHWANNIFIWLYKMMIYIDRGLIYSVCIYTRCIGVFEFGSLQLEFIIHLIIRSSNYI